LIKRYRTPEIEAIWSPEARTTTWLEVELAVCEALCEAGTIPHEDMARIRERAGFDLDRIVEIEKETKHDLMAFVRNVSERVGDAGRWVHFGVTSYDVIDTSLALMLSESVEVLDREIERLLGVVGRLTSRHAATPMIGRTHGVHAEPITFGFKLAGWYAELLRWRLRLSGAHDEVRVGKISGAVGIHGMLEPEIEARVCERLGVRPDPAGTQIVSRDRHAALLNVLAGLAASLERFATELRNLQRTEIREVAEGFTPGQTGSSAMPHKRNPWRSETICGLARLVRANAHAMVESVATWHERDLSNSSVERVVFPDSFHLVHFMLRRLAEILEGLRVSEERMSANLRLLGDAVFSEHLLLALVQAGMSREDAYAAVQHAAAAAWEGQDFRAAVLSDETITSLLTPHQIEECLSLTHHLRNARHTVKAVGLDEERE
jgi:adenylosuccinate lyase